MAGSAESGRLQGWTVVLKAYEKGENISQLNSNDKWEKDKHNLIQVQLAFVVDNDNPCVIPLF